MSANAQQHNPVRGHSLRCILHDLLKEAEQADGNKPYLIVYANGEPGILWSQEPPTQDLAGRLSANGAPIQQILPMGLRNLAGLLDGCLPVTTP